MHYDRLLGEILGKGPKGLTFSPLQIIKFVYQRLIFSIWLTVKVFYYKDIVYIERQLESVQTVVVTLTLILNPRTSPCMFVYLICIYLLTESYGKQKHKAKELQSKL